MRSLKLIMPELQTFTFKDILDMSFDGDFTGPQVIATIRLSRASEIPGEDEIITARFRFALLTSGGRPLMLDIQFDDSTSWRWQYTPGIGLNDETHQYFEQLAQRVVAFLAIKGLEDSGDFGVKWRAAARIADSAYTAIVHHGSFD